MEEGEKRLKQEDCNEDSFGPGILTLTNRRLAFDKTKGRIMDFSKQFGETVIDVPLSDVRRVWKEGLFIKKVCFAAKIKEGEKTYKFGVLGTGGWVEAIETAIEEYKNQ
jgi:hypothetical protein